jgi:hypothetical protein
MTENNTAAFAWDGEVAGMLRVNGYGGAFNEDKED